MLPTKQLITHVFSYFLVLLAGQGARGFVLLPTRIMGQLAAPPLSAELGELSSPKMPPFDPALIENAQQKLLWEKEVTPSDVPWQSGQLWLTTREMLVSMWILPRDLSNGADSRYAAAATKTELKILNVIPQLLRLEPAEVIASAKLLAACFPAGFLRSEPAFLAYPAPILQASIDSLLNKLKSKNAVMLACREDPSLLLTAVEEQLTVKLEQ
jgi:hypothetical protein